MPDYILLDSEFLTIGGFSTIRTFPGTVLETKPACQPQFDMQV